MHGDVSIALGSLEVIEEPQQDAVRTGRDRPQRDHSGRATDLHQQWSGVQDDLKLWRSLKPLTAEQNREVSERDLSMEQQLGGAGLREAQRDGVSGRQDVVLLWWPAAASPRSRPTLDALKEDSPPVQHGIRVILQQPAPLTAAAAATTNAASLALRQAIATLAS